MRQENGTSPLRVFGQQFAFFRHRAGLTSDQLGARVYLSGSAIRKLETGRQPPSENLVEAVEAMPDLGCNGALRNLYESMRDHLKARVFPEWFEDWPGKESVARRLRNFEGMFIPGLLQTGKYARTLLSSQVDATEDQIERDVTARLERQAILGRDKPVRLWVIIDEGALRRQVGSREDMREQFQHLLEMAGKSHVIIQVIPLGAGPHMGLFGAGFVLADFDTASTVAYQDTALRGQIIEDPEDVDALVLTWEAVQLVALPREASLRRIEELAETWN